MTKSIIKYKGFMIQEDDEGDFNVFTMDEWEMGKGNRYPEWTTQSLDEAKEWIDCY